MKKYLLMVLLISFNVYGEVPPYMNVQGFLRSQAGVPVNGTFNMKFSLYDAQTLGNEKWSETHSNVSIEKGLFSVILGKTPFGNVFDNPTLWLEVKIGDDPPLPRQQIQSVAYAFKAKKADISNIANDLQCSNCVEAGEIVPDAISTIHIQNNVVTADKVNFNYAGSSSKGGPAISVECSECIDSTHIKDWSVSNLDLKEDPDSLSKVSGGFMKVSNGTILLDNAKIKVPVIILSAPDGISPFEITSKTLVLNLNADMLDGFHASNFVEVPKAGVPTLLDKDGNGKIDQEFIDQPVFFDIMISKESSGNQTMIGQGSWTNAPGLNIDFNLEKNALVYFRWSGTLRWAGGGNGLCHVGFRFVIDGQPQGHPSWGLGIVVQEGGTRWHSPFEIIFAKNLGVGIHNVYAQAINATGYGNCYLDGDGGLPYDRSRLLISSYSKGNAFYVESTASTGWLGANSAWVDIPGLGKSFILNEDSHVQFSMVGTQRGDESSSQAHCAYRFVIDGQPLGNPSHGQGIVVQDANQGWWTLAALRYGTNLAKGNHSIKAQVRNSGSGASCSAPGDNNEPYARYRLFIVSNPQGGPNKSIESNSTGVTLGPNSAWTEISGLNTSFSLNSDSHVQFELAGTQHSSAGSYAHCAYRFVIDGLPLGNSSHGQAIHVGEPAETWWAPSVLGWGQDFKKGVHSVKVEMRNSSSSGGNCGFDIDNQPYSRFRLLIHSFGG